jgi:hypothetical protein
MQNSTVEGLESRLLMSAAQYNLVSLLGYNELGSSWTYNVSDTIVTDGKTSKNTGTGTVSVSSKQTKVGANKSDLVTLVIGKLKLGAAWYTNSKGVYIDLTTEDTSIGTVSLQLNNTQVGPAEMVVGKTYTGKGTFSASFSGKILGHSYTATISGSDSISGELSGNATVHVPAGTFSTVVGNYDATIKGKISVVTEGVTFPGTFSATHEQTFYAAPNVGVTKFTQIDNSAIDVAGIVDTSTKLTATGQLVSDKLT